MTADWTPEQIAAGAEALAHWNGYDSLDAAGEWGAATYRTEAAAVLSAVDLSDHDRAVARAAQPRPDHDYCAWCGWSRERDDSDVDHLRAHVMECPEHPLRLGSDSRDQAVAADALRQAADAAADNCASVLNDDDPTEANRWADTEHWLRARAEAVGDE